jgi:N-sulfoglucosamine sulfohydrolase
MRTLARRDLLRGAGLAALAGVFPLRAAAQAPALARPRWNLLFITADDLDSSLPRFMGGKGNLTPNLDALAARSHRFVNNRTVAPICMPSRQAFMTGLLPHHSGGTGFIPVNEGTPSLVTILNKAGYYTAGSHKLDHMLPASSFPWTYAQQAKDRHPMVHAAGARVALMEAAALGKPFFLQCNIDDPHRPFYGSAQADKMDHAQAGPYRIENLVQPEDVTVPPNLEDLPGVRRELAQYWNSTRRMDAAIGHILKVLEEAGHADNTVIVYCADHGMPFPFAKATCYDHGTRVPVLIHWPGMGAARTFPELTTNLDILPTLLDLLDAPAPAKLDGQSWLPIVNGTATAKPEWQFTYVNEVSSGMAYPTRAVQDDRYALIFSPWADGKLEMRLESMIGLTWPAMVEAAEADPVLAARCRQYTGGVPLALYDRKEDPGERRNLLVDPRHAARVTRMRDVLMKEMERTGDPQLANLRAVIAGQAPVVPQDPERYRLRGGEG